MATKSSFIPNKKAPAIDILCGLWHSLTLSKEILYTEQNEIVYPLETGQFSITKNCTFQQARISYHNIITSVSVYFSTTNLPIHLNEPILLFTALTNPLPNVANNWIIINTLHKNNESLLIKYTQKQVLPGFCGLLHFANTKLDISKLLLLSAEQRQVSKAQDILKTIKDPNDTSIWEQRLFEKLCQYLGQTTYASHFLAFAQNQQFDQLQQNLVLPLEQAKQQLLRYWLTEQTLLSKTLDYKPILKENKGNNFLATISASIKHTGRPATHPIRLLLGLFYHLHYMCHKGFFSSWLNFIHSSFTAIKSPNFSKRKFNEELDKLFPTPPTEELYYYSLPTSPTKMTHCRKLIGKQKQTVIFINAIIPVFLAWSLKTEQEELQHMLFALFCVFPNEPENHKTKLMQKKLILPKVNRQATYSQGLIQLFDSYCSPVSQTCENCLLPFVIRN